MCEALDAVMDMFAEDETDSLARDIQLVQKLEPLVPVLSNKVQITISYMQLVNDVDAFIC